MWYVIIVVLFAATFYIALKIREFRYDGKIIISKEDDKTIFSLELDIDPDDIEKMDIVVFKVIKQKIAD
jgi:hypothetical protein